MKIAINKCYGGFSISPEAMELLAAKKGVKLYWFQLDYTNAKLTTTPVESYKDVSNGRQAVAYTTPNPDDGMWFEGRPEDRSDPDLVAVVEELGEKANGSHAQLAIVEIPDDIEYTIQEYDGIEWIAESHRTWG